MALKGSLWFIVPFPANKIHSSIIIPLHSVNGRSEWKIRLIGWVAAAHKKSSEFCFWNIDEPLPQQSVYQSTECFHFKLPFPAMERQILSRPQRKSNLLSNYGPVHKVFINTRSKLTGRFRIHTTFAEKWKLFYAHDKILCASCFPNGHADVENAHTHYKQSSPGARWNAIFLL